MEWTTYLQSYLRITIMYDNGDYIYTDKSKLINAWTKYYTAMGLSYNKMSTKVTMRVRKGKFPNN